METKATSGSASGGFSFCSRLRKWMSGNGNHHSPYPGMLHDPVTDEQIHWQDKITRYLWELPEGAQVTIEVRYTMPPSVDPEDYWELKAPHTYGHHKKGSK